MSRPSLSRNRDKFHSGLERFEAFREQITQAVRLRRPDGRLLKSVEKHSTMIVLHPI